MAKYLFLASYTAHGTKGIMRDGGSSRRDQVDKMIRGLGGKLEAFYFALGDYDVYGIAELPDHAAATAMSMAINATGAVQVKTVVLMSPEEIDQASKVSVNYRPPGD